MLLPTSTASKRREVVVLVDDGRPPFVPALLCLSAALSPFEKYLFLSTNLPYFMIAACTITAASIPAAMLNAPPAPFVSTCASTSFHGAILFGLASISTYWHGAQCQTLEYLYCVDSTTGEARLHSLKWLKRLLISDVSCSLATVCVGIGCFGFVHTAAWLLLPACVFLWARRYKARGQHRAYAIGHGLWHLASALAISQILFNDGVPMASWVRPCS